MLRGRGNSARDDPRRPEGCSLIGQPEQALAARAGQGDVAAFTELVRRNEARVRGFLGRLAGQASADDLAQDTFLQAWRMAASFRGEGSYQGWLLRIAWRTFLSHGRPDPRALGEDAADLEQIGAVHNEAAVDIDRALAVLSPTERAAALLCYSEGRSHTEAAQILDLPLGTLKSTVARARTRLAAHLEGYDDRRP